MAKLKVFELAQELNVPSKDIMTYLGENGIVKKSHLNSIEEKEIELVKQKFDKKQEKNSPKPTFFGFEPFLDIVFIFFNKAFSKSP